MKINFEKYYEMYDENVLAGRPEGTDYRAVLGLDNIDTNGEIVEVIIPEYFFSLNSSFFLGCFGPSVRKLGEKNFRSKYIFICDSSLKKGIEDGISRALNESIVK